MKSLKHIIPFLLIFFSAFHVTAQKNETEIADAYFEFFLFDEAAKNYEAALAKDPAPTAYLYRQLALSYQFGFRYVQSESYYQKLIALNKDLQDEDYLDYGIMMKLNGKYEEAREIFRKYQELTNNKDPMGTIQTKSINWAIKTKETVKDVTLSLTDLDMSGQCLGYSLTPNGIIYSHSRNNKKMGLMKLFDLDYADRSDSIHFVAKPGLFNKLDFEANEGAPSLNAVTKLLYFNANASKLKNGKVKKVRGVEISEENVSNFKIYVTEFVDSVSGRLEELPFNGKAFNCIHPCINESGEILYFASDMPGGNGGLDLYMAKRNSSGGWGEPINLGTGVNTEANELFPHVSGDRLYFSSKGFMGYGGYDIYTSKLTANGMPAAAQNMGQPFNSFRDDLGLIAYDNGRLGYFSSNRDNNDGTDKLYYFHDHTLDTIATPPVKDTLVAQDTTKVIPAQLATVTPTTPVPVVIPVVPVPVPDMPSLADATIKKAAEPKPAPKAKVPAKKIRPLPKAKKEVEEIDAPEPVQPAIDRSGIDDELAAKHFDPVKFSINDFSVNGDYHIILDSVVRNSRLSKTIHIQIYGYADARGSAEYNLTLSLRRANQVKRYLMSKGFPANRIITAGFGETHPVNQCIDGVECSDEQHAANRRVEVQFIK